MLFFQQKHIKKSPSDRCIVFLHGFLGTSEDWEPYLAYFSSKDFHVIAPDLPGHGSSLSYELEELIPLIPKKTHLVGYSMGGRIALNLQKCYPNHFSSLTLISTNPGLRTAKEKKERIVWENQIIESLKTETIENFIQKWYQQSLFSGFVPPINRLHQNKDGLISAFRKFSIANLPSLWDYLSQSQLPIQMIFGAKDLKYSKLKQEVKKIDTNHRIKTYSVANCGHSVHLENPHLIFTLVENIIGISAEGKRTSQPSFHQT